MMNVYKIDDGADHWVIAATEADALAVFREVDGPQRADDDPPEVVLLTSRQAFATPFYEDDRDNPVGSMQSEFERDGSRRYVGCSEW